MTRTARAVLLVVVVATLGPTAASGRRRPGKGGRGTRGEIVLDGAATRVRWTDGDTFRLEDGPLAGRAARLEGVNTLETFGPVHRWGGWSGEELLAIARSSASLAAARAWRCTTEGRPDRYARLLVRCPDAALALVQAGHALAYAVDGRADAALVAAQGAARAARAGIWAKGTPPLVPTSVHSADEPDLGPRGAYDRIADTRTGLATARPHARVYAACDEICAGEGADRACMTYVPYSRRYRHEPACLRAR